MIYVPLEGGVFGIKVAATRSDCKWSVEKAPSWVFLHDKSGIGSGGISFAVERIGDGKRADAIVVNGESVTVVQSR